MNGQMLYRVTKDELETHLTQRIAHHTNRALTITESADELVKVTDEMPQVQDMRALATMHHEAAGRMAFALSHLPTEGCILTPSNEKVYHFSKSALVELELLSY